MKDCKHKRWCDWHRAGDPTKDVRRCWTCEAKEYRPRLQGSGIADRIERAHQMQQLERVLATHGLVINLNA